jgi:hypothetical protein
MRREEVPIGTALKPTAQLQINDVNKFEQALFQGIDQSKAFGCGLLSIAGI